MIVFTMKMGPHEVGTTVNFECFLDRIYPPIDGSSFNVTFKKNHGLFSSKVESVTSRILRLKVSGSINASLAYDGDIAICQITTALGDYDSEHKLLWIYGKI